MNAGLSFPDAIELHCTGVGIGAACEVNAVESPERINSCRAQYAVVRLNGIQYLLL